MMAAMAFLAFLSNAEKETCHTSCIRKSKKCDSDVCMTRRIPSGFPLVVHFKLIALCGLQVGKDTNYFPV